MINIYVIILKKSQGKFSWLKVIIKFVNNVTLFVKVNSCKE